MYYAALWWAMPQTLQKSVLYLYSEGNWKESMIIIGENIDIEENKYHLYISLSIPESSKNLNIPAVNVELWSEDQLIGKGYKSIQKHESIGSISKRGIESLGVLFSLYDDEQTVKVVIPAIFRTQTEVLKLKIFPEALEINHAEIVFEVKLHGIKYFIHKHFIAAFFIGVSWIVLIEFIFCFTFIAKKKLA